MTICQQRDVGTNSLRRYLMTGEYVNANGSNPAKKYVYFQDHLGSVRDLADADTGARVGALDYKPYGQVKNSYGVLPDYQYAGMMWVGEVGLNASATRFYDGGPTRWMTRDWIREAGGMNSYSYVTGNPLNRGDPMGLYFSFAEGVTAMDIAYFRQAVDYLRGSAYMAPVIDAMDKSPTEYKINIRSGIANDERLNEINWDPHLGLAWESETCPSYTERISPALSLGHELLHAYNNDVQTKLNDWDERYWDIPPAGYDTWIEFRNIERERIVASQLGESQRYWHSNPDAWFEQYPNPLPRKK